MSSLFVDGSLHYLLVLSLASTCPFDSFMVRFIKLDAIAYRVRTVVLRSSPAHHFPRCSSKKMRKAARSNTITENFQCISVPPDGNCAFHCLQYFLFLNRGIPIQPIDEFRRQTQAYIIANKAEIENHAQSTVGLDYMFRDVSRFYNNNKDYINGPLSADDFVDLSAYSAYLSQRYSLELLHVEPQGFGIVYKGTTSGRNTTLSAATEPDFINLLSSSAMQNTLCVLLANSHYYFLRPYNSN